MHSMQAHTWESENLVNRDSLLVYFHFNYTSLHRVALTKQLFSPPFSVLTLWQWKFAAGSEISRQCNAQKLGSEREDTCCQTEVCVSGCWGRRHRMRAVYCSQYHFVIFTALICRYLRPTVASCLPPSIASFIFQVPNFHSGSLSALCVCSHVSDEHRGPLYLITVCSWNALDVRL